MRSSAVELDHRPSKYSIWLACFATLAASQLTLRSTSAAAMHVSSAGALSPRITQDRSVVQVRAGVRRGGVAARPRGAVYRGRTAVLGPHGNAAIRQTTVVGGRGGWARPGWYRWPIGGAIAAGAAIGFVSAATAAAWAGAAPAPGMCWYYTDPTRTQGFWDYCTQ
jgi:hypothetical protein